MPLLVCPKTWIFQRGNLNEKKTHCSAHCSFIIPTHRLPAFIKLPVWSTIADLSKNIGDILDVNLAAYCTDPDGDSLNFSLVSGSGSVVGSLYSWTVTAPTGLKTIEVAASDGKG